MHPRRGTPDRWGIRAPPGARSTGVENARQRGRRCRCRPLGSPQYPNLPACPRRLGKAHTFAGTGSHAPWRRPIERSADGPCRWDRTDAGCGRGSRECAAHGETATSISPYTQNGYPPPQMVRHNSAYCALVFSASCVSHGRGSTEHVRYRTTVLLISETNEVSKGIHTIPILGTIGVWRLSPAPKGIRRKRVP